MRDKIRKILHRSDKSVKGGQSGSTLALNATESEAPSTATDKSSTSYDPRDRNPKASFDVGIESTTAAAKTAIGIRYVYGGFIIGNLAYRPCKSVVSHLATEISPTT